MLIFDEIGKMLDVTTSDKQLAFNKNVMIRNHVFNMLNKTQGMFDWQGLPDTIPQRNLELMLQSFGAIAFTKVNDNFYVFFGGLGGEPNVYYEPTIFTVANPALNYSANLKIGEECILIRNDATQQGLLPINNRYARMLCENEISLIIKDINYRLDNLISASDDATAESAKVMLQDLVLGKLGIISESEFFDGLKVAPTSHSGENIKDLIEYEQYIRATWLNELGIDANFNMKRERIQSEEVGQNKDALLTLPENMLECRRKAVEEINEKYDLEISVDFASAWLKEEVEQSIQGVDFDSDEDDNINEDSGNVESLVDNLQDESEFVESEEELSEDAEVESETDDTEEIPQVVEELTEAIEELTETIEEISEGESEVINNDTNSEDK